ncbi:ArgE/DapE family deacylase [Inquilinus sp. CAU 1745]|uniref:ArgE/DapE family deacylase n=1 Tax=Inquilinus sp. CAU 1745 TaxID=3140369 RepID=UPI00325B594F
MSSSSRTRLRDIETAAPSLPAGTADRILQAVDDAFEDSVALLGRLVRTPSLRGQERAVQEIVAEELAARGYEVERQVVDPSAFGDHPAFSPATIDYADTFNVVGHRRSAVARGRSLILNAHVDVVPTADPARWTHPPFAAARDGDWLYGRGAGDMKAGLVANIFALDALKAAGLGLTAPVQIQSVVDEEVTGNGAAAMIAAGHVADAVLIPEPTDEQLVRANSGVIKFAISVSGVPVHPREVDSGVSAIDAAISLMAHLRRLEERWNAERSRHDGFGDIANPAALNIGTFAGGEWPASVSCDCRFEGRIGFYPGDDPYVRAAEFEAFVAEVAAGDPRIAAAEPKIDWIGVMQGGYRLDPASDAERLFREAHGQAHGASPDAYVMPCYLDAALFALHAGMPALVYGPVAENIHGIDERVSLSSIRRVTKTIALFAAGWCGVEEAGATG